MIVSCIIFFRIRNVWDKVVQKLKTHILFSVTFFPLKSCHLWDNVEKCGTARQATDSNKVHAIWMLNI